MMKVPEKGLGIRLRVVAHTVVVTKVAVMTGGATVPKMSANNRALSSVEVTKSR
jgi:hypothetical protein